MEHWLCEKLYGEWDWERARKDMWNRPRRQEAHERSAPLRKLYQELYGKNDRAPDKWIPRCVACRKPLIPEGEKQAVVTYDRRLRRHIVNKGVLLSKTVSAGKGDSVFGHAACCLDSTSPVFEIIVDHIRVENDSV